LSTDRDPKKDQARLAKAREVLLKRQAELEEMLKILAAEETSDGQVQDLGDQALSSSMESLRQSLQNTEREEYNMILRALDAVKDGSYGVCIDCELEISEKRLKYYPNAVRCLACQEAAENG
jgi:DnaK suppressor protein